MDNGFGFEYRKDLFLKFCDLTGASRPAVIRPALPDDPCDVTNGDGDGEVRLNVEAARECEPEWHVAHVFGHWLADLHNSNKYAKSDEVADVIGKMALTSCALQLHTNEPRNKHKDGKPPIFEALWRLATTWFE
jgi:hypothetical protein